MSYLVLARKWRPLTFEAITGQEHVTRTLQNAIASDRVHHAFLFCGARGVGKTSAARVLARALNCRAEDGPTQQPCGKCEACLEITAGTSIDVLEIDGASNRGIGEIRELRDGVAYAPQRDRFKLYIIDEVHMLTTEAFNALLKTLEEPPSHVKFIFATTEPHKIPVTILSRCQRFDFKRIPMAVMVSRLQEILAAEEVSIDERGLRLVARESEGSMRDALSLLDRIISFAGKEAPYEEVARILGAADRRWLASVTNAALAREPAQALRVVQEVFDHGIDLKQFASDLVHYLRDLIVLRVAGSDSGLTDLADDEKHALTELGASQHVQDLERLYHIAARTAEKLAYASFPRLDLEMAVIRMCQLTALRPIDRIVERLESMERRIESGEPLPTRGDPDLGPSAGLTAPPTSVQSTSAEPANGSFEGREPAPKPEPKPELQAAINAGEEANAKTKAATGQIQTPSVPFPGPQPIGLSKVSAEHAAEAPKQHEVIGSPPSPSIETALEESAQAATTPETRHDAQAEPGKPEPTSHSEPAPSVPDPTTMDGDTEAQVAVSKPSAQHPLNTLSEPVQWEAFVSSIGEQDPPLAATLSHGSVLGVDDRGTLRLGFVGNSYNSRMASESTNRILNHLQERGFDIQHVAIESTAQVAESPYQRQEKRRDEALARRQEELNSDPLVRDIIDRFNGELLGTRVHEQERHS